MMLKNTLLPVLLVGVICFGCKKREKVDPGNTGGGTTKDSVNVQHMSVLTQHNDNTRAGLNSQEAALNTSNVNTAHFGRKFVLSVDAQVYAQPLVVGNVSISSGTHNVVYIATVNNTVYAYDADNGTKYWSNNYTANGMRPPIASDMNSSWCNPYNDFANSIGIVGTPVIDSAAQTIYFVARSTKGPGEGNFVQYLHAVDITSGAERSGSPVKITASVPGTGDGSSGGTSSFDPMRNNQRQGLVLVNGVVYISFSSHCDWNPYHGWILGYDAGTLQQTVAYNDTPDGEGGGIWECGMGIKADQAGNLYVTTGNGTVGKGNLYNPTTNGTDERTPNPDPTNPANRAESALRLTPSGNTMQVTSYFTPTNYVDLNVNDLDYGVMGSMLIPNSNYYLTACKDGNVYVLNKDNMGGYSGSSNQITQTIPMNQSMHCQPAYYKGSANEFVYIWPGHAQLQSFAFNAGSGQLTYGAAFSAANGPQYPGPSLSVSSKGTTAGTGIVWAYYSISGGGILRAFDAANVSKELWNSTQAIGDSPGSYAKFCAPTIANGKVYVATFSNQVMVYGLK